MHLLPVKLIEVVVVGHPWRCFLADRHDVGPLGACSFLSLLGLNFVRKRDEFGHHMRRVVSITRMRCFINFMGFKAATDAYLVLLQVLVAIEGLSCEVLHIAGIR